MDTSKLKKFDLQKALAGDPVVTQDGKRVISLAFLPDIPNMYHRLICAIENNDHACMYSMQGDPSQANPNGGLFMAPKTREVWVNLHQNIGFIGLGIGEFEGFETEEMANNAYNVKERIGNRAYKITIEYDTDASGPEKPLT